MKPQLGILIHPVAIEVLPTYMDIADNFELVYLSNAVYKYEGKHNHTHKPNSAFWSHVLSCQITIQVFKQYSGWCLIDDRVWFITGNAGLLTRRAVRNDLMVAAVSSQRK